MGIMNVYIQEGEPEPDNIEQMITPEAKKHIERLHKDDPAKVKLSDSVKNRVAEGIQYIYANTESEKLSDTADSIASNLMDAINANNAIAIDISTLKTSDEYTFKHSVDVATMAMIIRYMSLVYPDFYTISERLKYQLQYLTNLPDLQMKNSLL